MCIVCTELPESESLRGSLLISSLASFFSSSSCFLPIKRVVRQERGGGGGRFTVTLFLLLPCVVCAPASSSVFFSQEWKIASLGIRQFRFPIKKNIRKFLSFNRFISALFLLKFVWHFGDFHILVALQRFSLSLFFILPFRARPPRGGEEKVEMCAQESLLGLH